jgi:hypothetical protein
MTLPPSRAKMAAQQLLACLCTALGEAGWEGECCVKPGEVAWDSCCEDGGMAWVRLISIFPTDRYPFQGSPVDLTRSDTAWAARFEMGALTCVSAEAGCREDETERVYAMAEAGLRAIGCCAVEDDVCGDLRVGGLNMEGPRGMCAGFRIEVFASIGVCCDDAQG